MHEFSCCLNKRAAFSTMQGRWYSTESIHRKAGVVTHSKNLQYDFPTALMEVLLIKQVKSAISCFVQTPYITTHLSSRYSRQWRTMTAASIDLRD